MLNALDNINFNPAFNPGSGNTIFQVTTAYTDINTTFDPGGRLGTDRDPVLLVSDLRAEKPRAIARGFLVGAGPTRLVAGRASLRRRPVRLQHAAWTPGGSTLCAPCPPGRRRVHVGCTLG